MKRLATMAILLIVIVAGCISQTTQYVCPDGNVVSNSSLCNLEKESKLIESKNETKIRIIYFSGDKSSVNPGGLVHFVTIIENQGQNVIPSDNGLVRLFFPSDWDIINSPNATDSTSPITKFKQDLNPVDQQTYSWIMRAPSGIGNGQTRMDPVIVAVYYDHNQTEEEDVSITIVGCPDGEIVSDAGLCQLEEQEAYYCGNSICESDVGESKENCANDCAEPEQNETDEKYICNYNTYNCDHFSSQIEAQEAFEYCGGLSNDIHWLDGDDDGIACELLP
jgi:hypothetical protein